MTYILEIEGLSKHYRKIKAVDELSIKVPKKSVFGVLGPNGSGKTTTLGMILDVIEKTSGEYRWHMSGEEKDSRKKIGAILESPNFYPYLSGEKNLEAIARIKEVSFDKIQPVLKQVGLFDRKDDAFKTYSLGMKQRLAIASALLADPEVLILDEPTNGLDPKGILEIRQLIKEIAAEGRTILLASHLLDEVQKVCSHFCVLEFGKLIYQGEVASLTEAENRYLIAARNMEALKRSMEESELIEKIELTEGKYRIWLKDDIEIEALVKQLTGSSVYPEHLSKEIFSLEQKFIEILDSK